MKQSQFQKGNYNEWSNIVTKLLPETDTILRDMFLPKLDGALKSMLGGYADIKREELNACPFIDADSFKGVSVEITYIVEDFHVQNVPEEAVIADEDALSDYLTEKNIEIQELKIDTMTGKLKLEIAFLFPEESDRSERI